MLRRGDDAERKRIAAVRIGARQRDRHRPAPAYRQPVDVRGDRWTVGVLLEQRRRVQPGNVEGGVRRAVRTGNPGVLGRQGDSRLARSQRLQVEPAKPTTTP